MNDLGVLAQEIVTYDFPDDTGKFPVPFVSGWLSARVGDFNAVSHSSVELDISGNFTPSLCDIQSGIFRLLYEINYYNRAAREALRGVIWGGPKGFKDSITMVKEGDTTIQKVSNYQISRTFNDFAKDANKRMNDVLFQYTNRKASPRQVAGEDGNE